MQRRIFIGPTSHMNNYWAAAVPTFYGMARKVPSTTPSVCVSSTTNLQCHSRQIASYTLPMPNPTLGKVVTAAGHLSFWTYLV